VGFIRPCHWTGDSDPGGLRPGGYVRSPYFPVVILALAAAAADDDDDDDDDDIITLKMTQTLHPVFVKPTRAG